MRCRVSYVQSCTHPCGRAQREALTAAKKNPAPLAAAPRKIAGAPSGDMKRDTGTKVYPTDADATKKHHTITLPVASCGVQRYQRVKRKEISQKNTEI